MTKTPASRVVRETSPNALIRAILPDAWEGHLDLRKLAQASSRKGSSLTWGWTNVERGHAKNYVLQTDFPPPTDTVREDFQLSREWLSRGTGESSIDVTANSRSLRRPPV